MREYEALKGEGDSSHGSLIKTSCAAGPIKIVNQAETQYIESANWIMPADIMNEEEVLSLFVNYKQKKK